MAGFDMSMLRSRRASHRLVVAVVGAALMTLGLLPGRAGAPPADGAASASTYSPRYADHVDPTPGATSVLDAADGLTGDANVDGDATGAFASAIADALAGAVRYPSGPTGDPQAVVYVPPGSYRLSGLAIPSDVRLEVDAGAVLEAIVAPAGRPLTAQDPTQMILLGSHDVTPVTNVTIVGVGEAVGSDLKQRAEPTYDGWDIGGYFTVDLDAADTGSPNDYAFASLINVVGFSISNVYIVQNATIPTCTAKTSTTCPVGRGFYPAPTNGRAAIVYKPGHASGRTSDGPFYDPTDGVLANVYNLGAPYGFGPTQIASGHDLDFDNLYSLGGTTLRLETDDAAPRLYLGELARVTATHVVGESCNRAVSLSAHRQVNHAVAVSDVTALGCQNGFVQAAVGPSGTFTNTTVDDITVLGGAGAQVPIKSAGLWRVGTSTQPVQNKVPQRAWSAAVTGFGCQGSWTKRAFDPFELDGVMQVPVCS